MAASRQAELLFESLNQPIVYCPMLFCILLAFHFFPGDTMHPHNPYYSRTDTAVLNVSDEEWRSVLPPEVFESARHKDTEYPFTGKYNDFTGLGNYFCAACGNALFRSDAKFASTCGWPSFFETIRKNSVVYHDDRSLSRSRIEVVCGRCGGHLGHVFDDGPPPTGKRYCMNSLMLDFEPDGPSSHK